VKNPNTYSDDAYAQAVGRLDTAISLLWEAGAEIENIETEIANSIENATGFAVLVDLDGDGRFAAS
jgi:hypothetical protein